MSPLAPLPLKQEKIDWWTRQIRTTTMRFAPTLALVAVTLVAHRLNKNHPLNRTSVYIWDGPGTPIRKVTDKR